MQAITIPHHACQVIFTIQPPVACVLAATCVAVHSLMSRKAEPNACRLMYLRSPGVVENMPSPSYSVSASLVAFRNEY